MATLLGAGRSGSWYRQSGLMALAWSLPLLATVVVTPALIDLVGPAEYGLFGTVLGLVVGVAAIGLSRPLMLSLAGGQPEDAKRSIRWGVASAVAGGMVVLGLAAAVPSPWLAGTGVAVAQARTAIAAGAFAVVGTALMSTMSGVASGRSRFGALAGVTAAAGTATSAGYLLLARAGHGAPAFVLWAGVVALVGAASFLIVDRRTVHHDPVPEPSVARPAASLTPFVLVQLAGHSAIIVERAALAVTTGFAVVTAYVIPHTLVLTLHGALASVATPLVTRAAERHAVADHVGLVALYRRASRMTATMAALGGITLAVVGRPLLSAWLDGQSVIALGPFLLLMVYATALPLTIVAWGIADATGNAVVNAWAGGIWFLGVAVGAALTPWWGITATTAGRAFLALTIPTYLAVVERRALGSPRVWGLAWTSRLVAAAALAGAVEYASWVLAERSLIGIGLSVVLGTAVFVLIAGPRRNIELFFGSTAEQDAG